MISAVLSLIFVCNFFTVQPDVLYGTYGVCNSGDEVKLSLTLHDNNVFEYKDFTDPEQKIAIKGRWKFHNNSIQLLYGGDQNMADVWRISSDGKCLRARNGMKYTRLCHLDHCD